MSRSPKTSNSKFEKRLRVKQLLRNGSKCSICPPNKGCNQGRRVKHGAKKPKYKDKR